MVQRCLTDEHRPVFQQYIVSKRRADSRSVSVLMLDLLERYDLHIIMLRLWRFILGCGSLVLGRAHLLHGRWVDDGHLNSSVVCEATFPFTMLLTVCAPVQAAVDHARIAWRVHEMILFLKLLTKNTSICRT